jgi:hypothetical protein
MTLSLSNKALVAILRTDARALTKALTGALLRVAEDRGRGAVGEMAGDVQALRQDFEYQQTLAWLRSKLRSQIAASLVSALVSGFETRAAEDGRTVGLRYIAEPSDQVQLARIPIHGALPAELAQVLVDAWARALWASCEKVLVHALKVEALPGEVTASIQSLADAVSRAVDEAEAVGAGLGTQAVRQALAARKGAE